MKEFITKDFVIKTLVFSLAYTLMAFALMNLPIILNVLSASYEFSIKINVLSQLFITAFLVQPITSLITTFIIAFLFGVNTALILKRVSAFKKSKELKVSFGIGILSVAASGCASCGFSLLSLAGLGGTLAVLPFHGAEFSYLAIITLALSIGYNYNKLKKSCPLPRAHSIKPQLALQEAE